MPTPSEIQLVVTLVTFWPVPEYVVTSCVTNLQALSSVPKGTVTPSFPTKIKEPVWVTVPNVFARE